jgi:glucosylceramidase
MRKIVLALLIGLGFAMGTPSSLVKRKATLVTSTQKAPWVYQPSVNSSNNTIDIAITIDTKNTQQTINGFGTCFNEQGWTSLSELNDRDRKAIFNELFAPGVGANFTICRMPLGANDFSLDWYSYNEKAGDFNMENFSIENDTRTLIPFIKSAQQVNPNLKIWASPWSPPSWMKTNKHYASVSLKKEVNTQYNNGLPVERQGKEGTDMFIQQDQYFKAYALYFSKFIDAYKAQGIKIFAVMPQNEFNSPQVFPSCCWTPKGLSTCIGRYLGPAMSKKGVDVLLGTMERPDPTLVETILKDSKSRQYIKGVGFQWAGKEALPFINEKYPNLKLYQSEQECGDGANNWAGTLHSWDLMKQYLNNGVSVYEYWNTSLLKGGISRWGWAQNSLVVVDSVTQSFFYTPEYYLMKHVSHFVKPGAKKIKTGGTNSEVLAFINLDKSVAIVLANRLNVDKQLKIQVDKQSYLVDLKANSFSTLSIK